VTALKIESSNAGILERWIVGLNTNKVFFTHYSIIPLLHFFHLLRGKK